MNDKHQITEKIKTLILQSIADNRGSKAAFCRITGISKYNLSKILSGKKKFVFGDNWNRLCDYFPEIDDRSIHVNGNGNAVNGTIVNSNNSNADLLETIISRVMSSDISAEDKVKVYNIIMEVKGK